MTLSALLNFLSRQIAVAIVIRVLPLPGGTTIMWFFFEPRYPGWSAICETAMAMAVYILFGSCPTNLMLHRTYCICSFNFYEAASPWSILSPRI